MKNADKQTFDEQQHKTSKRQLNPESREKDPLK
jgi:hypothetical protein